MIGAITPYNDPLNLVAHKLAPALIGGNGVVLKPAEQTPLTALAFVELLLEAGVPAGRLAVLPGRGATVGAALVGHPLVDMVSFTGGYATGDAVARAAGAKKTLMELGGNGAVIVLPDADVERAAKAIVERRVRRRRAELPVRPARVRRTRGRRPAGRASWSRAPSGWSSAARATAAPTSDPWSTKPPAERWRPG